MNNSKRLSKKQAAAVQKEPQQDEPGSDEGWGLGAAQMLLTRLTHIEKGLYQNTSDRRHSPKGAVAADVLAQSAAADEFTRGEPQRDWHLCHPDEAASRESGVLRHPISPAATLTLSHSS